MSAENLRDRPRSHRRADIRPADHDERLRVAERAARWYLGDRGYGGMIVGAYLWPDETSAGLDREEGAQ